MKKFLFSILIFLLAVSIFCEGNEKNSKQVATKKQETLKFEGSRLEVVKLLVGADTLLTEIAAKPEDREQGLMNRQLLPENAGMRFVFEYTHNLSFWMRNTEIPLSIAYIDESMKIIDIQDMKPWDDSSYESKAPARYALEVNQGWFEKHGIKVGDKVSFITE